MLHVLSHRVVCGEKMDLPGIEERAHRQALAGLGRINRISGTVGQILPPILYLARQRELPRISLLDVACGGGDVATGVALGVRQAGIEVNLVLLDKSATALQTASATARRAGLKCQTIEGDAVNGLEGVKVDVVMNSLFLHHLRDEAEAIRVLSGMKAAAGRLVVVSDLRREGLGFAAAWVGCHLLSRSEIVHFDGPASVRAAWTQAEFAELAKQADLKGATIERCWPWRMRLVWERMGGGE